MKSWKVLIEHKNKFIEIDIQADSYADAYIKTELEYPGCKVKSITEVRKTGSED